EDFVPANVVSLAGNALIHQQDVGACDVADIHDNALAGKRADLDGRLLEAFEDADNLIDVGGDREAAATSGARGGERASNEEAELFRSGALADVKVGGSFTYSIRIDRADGETFVNRAFGLERRSVDFGGGAKHHAGLRGDGAHGFAEVDGAGGVGE